jgi:hypothetical protein
VTRGIGTLVPVRTKRSILAVCSALFLAAACSSGGGAAPVVFLEKSTAVVGADAICKQGNADLKQALATYKSAHPNPSADEARDFWVNTYLPRLDRYVGDIHRLGEPTKEKVAWDQAVIALDKALSQLKTEISADPVKALAGSTAFDNAHKLFDEFGATNSSSSSSSSEGPGQRFEECNKPLF